MTISKPQVEKKTKKDSFLGPKQLTTLVFVTLLVAGHSMLPKYVTPLPGVADNKPFNTFEEFYPFYLSQHADLTCRRLHFVGTCIIFALAVMQPEIILSLGMGLLAGHTAFPYFRSLDHGFIEMAILLVTYLTTMKLSTGCLKKAFVVLLIGYGFAWSGHYMYEHNHPATFIYPTFSLMSDFKLWFEIATQQRAF